jgi:hypothetical protein
MKDCAMERGEERRGRGRARGSSRISIFKAVGAEMVISSGEQMDGSGRSALRVNWRNARM